MKLYVVIPVFNEQDQIAEVIDQLKQVLEKEKIRYQIITVDDGSTDSTYAILSQYQRQLPIKIIQHDMNRGVSEAFRNGFNAYITEASPDDPLLTMEANRNADPNLIPKMIAELANGSELILASCYAPGGKVIGDPFLRLLLSKGINYLLRLIFPLNGIHTYTSFYRLWNYQLIRSIHSMTDGKFFKQEGFVCMADMLLKIRHLESVRVKEIPFILYSDTKRTGSKMKVGKTIWGYLKLFTSNIFNKQRRVS
ncbi:glycosyltransferase [bacterium]|nr:glycosyltransferase [candidate division CSSED10-310 bacterium]